MKIEKNSLMKAKAECCGCKACYNACPVAAISMETDGEGFAYPHIDGDKCIACNKCLKVCPFKDDSTEDMSEPVFYAARAKEGSVRFGSSSGGLFPLLAEGILKRGGLVAAASMDQDLKAIHKTISNSEALSQLTKTKYVQSDMGDIHKEIASSLEKGIPVLFCGTPCQTESVRKYCKKAENLYLIDLVCYGVPSPGLWKSYINWLQKKREGTIVSFSFRDKRKNDNGHLVSYLVEKEDGSREEITDSLYADPYCMIYFLNLDIRPSCHECNFCKPDRKSDITIGDFWGIEKVFPDMEDGRGNSLAIIHTTKGKKLWEEITPQVYSRECRREDVLQPRLTTPTPANRHRGLFMTLYRILPFSILKKLVWGRHGIRSFWRR